MAGKPEAGIVFSEPLLRGLLERQHADLSSKPLVRVGSGWDFEIWQLGEDLAMRLPRRSSANQLAVNEHRWLPHLAPTLPLSVPCPVRVGRSDSAFPWCWSIVPWFGGRTAERSPPNASTVDLFVDFLRVLHVEAPEGAPFNPLRGVQLSAREPAAQVRLVRLRAETDVVSTKLQSIWQRGMQATAGTNRVWLHGDLHAGNVVTRRGRIEAVIDWGDMCAGDAATDLASVWSLYPNANDREHALQRYTPDQAMLDRAMAWAAFFVLVLIDSGRHNSPRHERQGREMLRRLLADY